MGQLTAKIGAYLELAEDVVKAAEQLVETANAHQSSPAATPLTTRDRVLIALARKIEGALRALLADVREERSEAMHHLKTMAESFIYYHVVASDQTQETATLVLAKTYDEKVRFFRANPGFVADDEVARWEGARDLLLDNGRLSLKRVKNLEILAKKHGEGLRGWYARAYRLACEPAHIGDLQELIPGPDGRIATEPPVTAEYRALIAVDLALQLCVGLMTTISEMNEPGIQVETGPLQERLDRLRGMPTGASS